MYSFGHLKLFAKLRGPVHADLFWTRATRVRNGTVAASDVASIRAPELVVITTAVPSSYHFRLQVMRNAAALYVVAGAFELSSMAGVQPLFTRCNHVAHLSAELRSLLHVQKSTYTSIDRWHACARQPPRRKTNKYPSYGTKLKQSDQMHRRTRGHRKVAANVSPRPHRPREASSAGHRSTPPRCAGR